MSEKSASKFDLVILGGGPAGYTAAIKGALQGFKVAVVERDRIGGACINRGCIPTKALWGTALSLQRLKDLKDHGIQTSGTTTFDFAVAVKRQFQIMDQMVATIQSRMRELNVVSLSGEGIIEHYDPKPRDEQMRFTIALEKSSVGGPIKLHSKFVLLATGSRPAESEILQADHKQVVTTDDIVLFDKLPKSMAIVGGGVVACEFASIMNKFGVAVHLLEHSGQVLSAMDPEVVGMLMQYLNEDGISLKLSTKVQAVERKTNSVQLTLDTAGTKNNLEVEVVLLAIGRKPNSENLGLEAIGVRTTPRNHIIVDDHNETDCKGLYAAGDVIGGQMLAHKAWYDATIAVGAMSGEEAKTNYDTVPGAIFTIPEMAAVGLQPDQARQKGFNICIGKFAYAENSQALCVGKTRGLVKVVIDRDSDAILGCTMIGHDASNLISEVALAISAGLKAKDIARTIHPHPTLSEMVWESFMDTQGLSIHKHSR